MILNSSKEFEVNVLDIAKQNFISDHHQLILTMDDTWEECMLMYIREARMILASEEQYTENSTASGLWLN